MKIGILTTAVVAAAVLFAPTAHADVDLCAYLDAHPTVAGVEDVIAMAIYGNGMTPEQAAEAIFNEIDSYCPRHFFTMQMAMDAYGIARPGDAQKKMI